MATVGDQSAIGVGPVPRGHYFILPEEFSGGGVHAFVRDLFGNWGTWRIPLHPAPGGGVLRGISK